MTLQNNLDEELISSSEHYNVVLDRAAGDYYAQHNKYRIVEYRNTALASVLAFVDQSESLLEVFNENNKETNKPALALISQDKEKAH